LLRLTAQHSAARSAQEAHGVPVDLQALLILLDGDLELLRELTSDFIALGNASLATLADSLQSDDRDSIAATAHALKGASANLRATVVSSLAADLEQGASRARAGSAAIERPAARGVAPRVRLSLTGSRLSSVLRAGQH
jgi:HPt (histidine-containing phosphotransfer) domain-containing protein